jgi:hypothetical protein
MRASLLIAAIILIPVVAQAQDVQPASLTTGVPDLTNVVNDPNTTGMKCLADGSKETVSSIIEQAPSTMKVLHVDKLSQTGTTVSGNDMCQADLFTTLGPLKVQYEWFSHAGEDYMATFFIPPVGSGVPTN